MKLKPILLIFITLFFLSGCTLFDFVATKTGYDKKEKVELRIKDLKDEREEALRKQAIEINKAKDDYYKQLRENFQNTINWTYGATLASSLKTNKTRLDNILDYRLTTALSFGPAPTPEAIIYQNKLLREELDERKVTDEALAKRYEEKEKEAQAARVSEAAKSERVKALEEKIPEIERKYAKEIDDQYEALNKINGDLIALKTREAERMADENSLKKYLIGILCVGAAGAAIGAYFMRSLTLAVVAIFIGGAAIAVPFIKPWMIITAIGAVIIVAGFIAYKQLYEEKIISNGAIGTIQERRNEAEDDYQQNLKPKLKDWFKDAPKLHKKVEDRLKELNLK